MEVNTQDDFIVAVMATCFRDDKVDEASEGLFEFVQHIRSEEERYDLVEEAERLLTRDPVLPSREELKKLSEIFTELPRNRQELLEIQRSSN